MAKHPAAFPELLVTSSEKGWGRGSCQGQGKNDGTDANGPKPSRHDGAHVNWGWCHWRSGSTSGGSSSSGTTSAHGVYAHAGHGRGRRSKCHASGGHALDDATCHVAMGWYGDATTTNDRRGFPVCPFGHCRSSRIVWASRSSLFSTPGRKQAAACFRELYHEQFSPLCLKMCLSIPYHNRRIALLS